MIDSEDMAKCARVFFELEEYLNGEKCKFLEWMKIVYDLHDTTEMFPAEMANHICNVFKEIRHKYGNKIALDLYNTQSAVLPREMIYAAEYLHLNGKIENVRELCDVGYFMECEQYEYDIKVKIVEYVNNGGSIDDLFHHINSIFQDKQENELDSIIETQQM